MDQPPPNVTVVRPLPRLPPRASDSHKGTFGLVQVVAGSRGMSGAAVLCASGALRGGAGLVRVATPAGCQPIVATANPCYMTLPLPENTDGQLALRALPTVLNAVRHCTVAVVGPGLGPAPAAPALVAALLDRTTTPLVLDADGLNALSAVLPHLRGSGRPVVLTPHPGEFARLLGCDIAHVQADRMGLAARFAAEHGCIVVLKGHGTVVTDGRRAFVNPTGNPGMATGGTGDVLGGLLGALLAQGLPAFEAAQLAVYLHGLAGDLAARRGEVSLIASDLLDTLPDAFIQRMKDER
jgi:NAD(P)H-hydrate epimerase